MENEMQYVGSGIDDILKTGLIVEVIVWSLKAMKENPSLTIQEAFEIGCEEWDV